MTHFLDSGILRDNMYEMSRTQPTPVSPPEELVQKSLLETARFARSILPFLKTATEHVKKDIETLPIGGARSFEVENQLAPTLVRLRLHQLIVGHNQRAIKTGEAPHSLRRSRNGSVCLMFQDCEYRLLKDSKWFPTKPAGTYQERLINQTTFRNYIGTPNLFGEETVEPPLLNGLIYYQMSQLNLLGAYVVIPNSFINNRVNVQARMEIDLQADDLEQIATFMGIEQHTVLSGSNSLLLNIDNEVEALDDPFAESDMDIVEYMENMDTDTSLLHDEIEDELK